MRNALAYVPKTQETVVAAAIRQAFAQPDRDGGPGLAGTSPISCGPGSRNSARLMDEAEHDVLAYMTSPRSIEPSCIRRDPLERLNKEVKRRADVVGIFPNEGIHRAALRAARQAVLMEHNDDWQTQRSLHAVEGFGRAGPDKIKPTSSRCRLHPRRPDQ